MVNPTPHLSRSLDVLLRRLGLCLLSLALGDCNGEPNDGPPVDSDTPIVFDDFEIVVTPLDPSPDAPEIQMIGIIGERFSVLTSEDRPLYPGAIKLFHGDAVTETATSPEGGFAALLQVETSTREISLQATDPQTELSGEKISLRLPVAQNAPPPPPAYEPLSNVGVFARTQDEGTVLIEGRAAAQPGAQVTVANTANGESTTVTATASGDFQAVVPGGPEETFVVVQSLDDRLSPPLEVLTPPAQCPNPNDRVLYGQCREVSDLQPTLVDVPGTLPDRFEYDAANEILFISRIRLLTAGDGYLFLQPISLILSFEDNPLPNPELLDSLRAYFSPETDAVGEWLIRAGHQTRPTQLEIEAARAGFFRVGLPLEEVCANDSALDALEHDCFDQSDAESCFWLESLLSLCGTPGRCGDGFVNQPDESCDDRNNRSGDGCDEACRTESCGDGVVQTGLGEECDDANENSNDACLSGCRNARCGDGWLWEGVESCDDGLDNGQPGQCDTDCIGFVQGVCGNKIPEPEEECDDGNVSGGDGCSAVCRLEICGNGVLDDGEGCDDANLIPGDGCDETCRNESCGDGVLTPTEECDDAGNLPGDGCDENCLIERCGNGVLQTGETCDDGNLSEEDACLNDCRYNLCGDGFRYRGVETCDDGDLNGTPNRCASDCSGLAPSTCGNGVVETGEFCDGQIDVPCQNPVTAYLGTKRCNEACRAMTPCVEYQTCGDGLTNGLEICDDGALNGSPNQCDAVCAGITPSLCGNNIVEAGETCDDGADPDPCDGCTDACVQTSELCGNGAIDCAESCDDGTFNGQRGACDMQCGGTCSLDIHWTRQGSASLAQTLGGNGVALDSQGNLWVTGWFQGIMTLGAHSIASAGAGDLFVAKFDPNGNPLWLLRGGGAAADEGQHVTTDAQGNGYLIGRFSDLADFGPFSLVSAGNMDILVAKISPNGDFLWAFGAGGPTNNSGFDIAMAPDGDLRLLGTFGDDFGLGATSLSSIGGDSFVARMDANGNILWASQTNGPGWEFAKSIATDSDGASYITGSFEAGDGQFGTHALANAEFADIFFAKLDANGNFLWAQGASGGYETGIDIVVDAQGNAYATGYYNGSLTLGSQTHLTAGNLDGFLVKLDPNGTPLWSRSAGGAGTDVGRIVALDSGGNPYLAGWFQQTVSLPILPSGFLNISSAGGYDSFWGKFDPNGNPIRLETLGGAGQDLIYDMRLDPTDRLLLSGSFAGQVQFGDSSLTALTPGGGGDLFAGAYGQRPLPACWVCGDGWVDPGETCDDGNPNVGDGCDDQCMGP